MNNNETQGKAKKIAGRVKQAAGILVGDQKLEQEGAADRADGAIREGVGRAQRKVGKFVEELGEKIQRS